MSELNQPYDPDWKEKIARSLGYKQVQDMDTSDKFMIELIDKQVVQPLLNILQAPPNTPS